jgi:hypothetical protein
MDPVGREYLHPDDDGECLIVKWLAGKRSIAPVRKSGWGVGSCVTRFAGPNDVAQLYAKQCSRPNCRFWTAGADRGVRWISRLVATAAEDRLNIRHDAQVVCGSQRSPHNPDL